MARFPTGEMLMDGAVTAHDIEHWRGYRGMRCLNNLDNSLTSVVSSRDAGDGERECQCRLSASVACCDIASVENQCNEMGGEWMFMDACGASIGCHDGGNSAL